MLRNDPLTIAGYDYLASLTKDLHSTGSQVSSSSSSILPRPFKNDTAHEAPRAEHRCFSSSVDSIDPKELGRQTQIP